MNIAVVGMEEPTTTSQSPISPPPCWEIAGRLNLQELSYIGCPPVERSLKDELVGSIGRYIWSAVLEKRPCTYDFLLDHAQFCPDAILTMCSASHCPITLFVSDKGAWQRFDFILPGYEEFPPRRSIQMRHIRPQGRCVHGGRETDPAELLVNDKTIDIPGHFAA